MPEKGAVSTIKEEGASSASEAHIDTQNAEVEETNIEGDPIESAGLISAVDVVVTKKDDDDETGSAQENDSQATGVG